MRTFLLLLLTTVALVVSWKVVRVNAQDVQLAPIEGLLLLKNGEVLRGRITKSGDRYFIWLEGGEIRIPAKDVDLVCQDMEDGYRKKRDQIIGGRVTDHLLLADWCLHHKLIGPAEEQIEAARQGDAGHPRIDLLNRRLALLKNAPPVVPVVTVPVETGPSLEELDRLVKEVPPGTLHAFTQTIQPLLVNSCTTSGCHGPLAETKFTLFRVPAGESPRRRITMRNLHAVLQQVDGNQPSESLLLKYALTRHGRLKTAPFPNVHALQYQQLLVWSQAVAASAPQRAAPEIMPAGGQSEAPGTGIRKVSSEVLASPGEPQPGDAGPAQPVAPNDPGAEINFPKLKRPKIEGAFVPVDPFDAEAFNRRFQRPVAPAKPAPNQPVVLPSDTLPAPADVPN